MSLHTPTPWHVEPLENDIHGIAICAPNIGIIATIQRPDDGLCDNDQADAAYIVNCCNLFPEMLASLRAMCERYGYKNPILQTEEDATARALLKRLECFK